jgi:hypothetical protein
MMNIPLAIENLDIYNIKPKINTNKTNIKMVYSLSPAPPNAVEITNHPHNSKLEVKEGEDVSLECLVKNAKPAAKIIWYRNNVELKGDKGM